MCSVGVGLEEGSSSTWLNNERGILIISTEGHWPVIGGLSITLESDCRVEGIFRQKKTHREHTCMGNSITWSGTYKHINMVGVEGLYDGSGLELRRLGK